MPLDKSGLFYMLADALEGRGGRRVKIGLTALGSEHPPKMLVDAAQQAAQNLKGVDVVVIGPGKEISAPGLESIEASTLEEAHRIMERMLDSGELDAAVTMHYNFPIGVSTVGRVVTPARGRSMLIATTTGTSATNRVEAMVKNAVYGIITAKALGIENPRVGILNLDGSRQVERTLKLLAERGYEINFAESVRADGGCIMRGNDLLAGSCDVMVTDTLTGNILMKVFSAYTTGGDYEALGWGYGPGIGEGYRRIILILSRASGAPVVEGAIKYAAELVRGNLLEKAAQEFEKLRAVKFHEILAELDKAAKPAEAAEITPPPKKSVTEEIAGIDVLQVEDAVKVLWKNGIYAESGMGCTGPVILVAHEDLKSAVDTLKAAGYL
ncbi:glycine/sarcosine/betaine reductase complex component C subunit alpha [Thermosediminibacter oceani]|uniref:phosphate acyltransferase n=1 Tax=Thermosediminibacter oceani (strain ATCC BAA-1034 / DSM 16646 / JW/IW-1228P) TaxID=555079 RepID=D9RYD1_THEOJ|nr:glycine/sarcosine/betaine reductase complex component C subunit alpha [Thermosediminibacter oceani]ADL08355.1 fatty acid synthesis plsX protein [Thermosediminibacter oceani DSM 16646]